MFIVVMVAVGFALGVSRAVVKRRRRRESASGPVVEVAAVLPSRLRDPETGELL